MSISKYNPDDLPKPPLNWVLDDTHNGLIFCGILPLEIEYIIYSFNGQVPPINKYNIIKNLTLSFNKECLGNELINKCIELCNIRTTLNSRRDLDGRDDEYWRLMNGLRDIRDETKNIFKELEVNGRVNQWREFNKIDALIYPKLCLEGLQVSYGENRIEYNHSINKINPFDKYGNKDEPIQIRDLTSCRPLDENHDDSSFGVSKRIDIDYVEKYKLYRKKIKINSSQFKTYDKRELLQAYLNKNASFPIKSKKKIYVEKLFELYGIMEHYRPKLTNKKNLENLKKELFPNMDKNVKVSKRLNPDLHSLPYYNRDCFKYHTCK